MESVHLAASRPLHIPLPASHKIQPGVDSSCESRVFNHGEHEEVFFLSYLCLCVPSI